MTGKSLDLPTDLVRRMQERRDVAWDAVIIGADERKLDEVDTLDRIFSTSRLTEEDAEEIGHRIKAGQRRRTTGRPDGASASEIGATDLLAAGGKDRPRCRRSSGC